MSKKLKIIVVALASLFWVWYVADTLTINGPPPKKEHAPEVLKTAQEVGVEPDLTNSTILYDLGYGQFMRIPKALSLDFRGKNDSNIAHKAEGVNLSLMYPEMVYADILPDRISVSKLPEQKVIEQNKFQVFVGLFYAPDELKDAKTLPGISLSFRPARILANRAYAHVFEGRNIDPLREVPSKITGLDAVYLESELKTDPGLLNAAPENGATYVAPADAAYDLLLDCDAFQGMACRGQVFIKKTRFQYSVKFPSGKIVFAVDLIDKINKNINSWIVKSLY